ncbi:MAG: beta-ketoacyl-ACP synthase 3, partial [Methylococcales bacterium]|nr:beta-ketoacyl-ACP synthase 3 [Methylococcales bacterium]
ACTGFVYALNMASQAIATGSVSNALVIGAETMSRVLDWRDRGTCILFGDGAGAVVLQGSDVPGGVLAGMMRSDGSGGNLLSLPAVYHNPVPTLGPEFLQNGHKRNTIAMNGRQVFRFATRVVHSAIEEVIEKAGLTMEDISLIVPHQANSRIINYVAKKLKLPKDKFYVNLDRTGNTSAASIPIALCEAVEAGLLKPDDYIVFVGFGGGLTWAATAVKWNVVPPDVKLLDSEWGRVRYVWARGRSRLKKWSRLVGARLSGSHTPDARLRDADKKKE